MRVETIDCPDCPDCPLHATGHSWRDRDAPIGAAEDGDRSYAVNDSIGWDDRKTLAGLWQEHAPLPEMGLSEETYDALLAVARWGAGRMYDNHVSDVGASHEGLVEFLAGMCAHKGYEPHRCNVLIAAHDAAMIVRQFSRWQRVHGE